MLKLKNSRNLMGSALHMNISKTRNLENTDVKINT